MAAGGRFVLQGFCSEVSAGLLTTYVFADYARLRLKARVFFFNLRAEKITLVEYYTIFRKLPKIGLGLGLIRFTSCHPELGKNLNVFYVGKKLF